MSDGRAYLDANATAPLRPEAAAAMRDALGRWGNPSSVHAEGRAARAIVERAREAVAALVRARPQDVVFTSGGTEANATVLRPGTLDPARNGGATWLAVSATEHASVLDGHGFAEQAVEVVPVGADGCLRLDRLEELLARRPEPALVSVQMANSETGIVQPIAAVAAIARACAALLHTDAVQAAGRLPIDLAELGVAALTLSAHKLGGPQGIGALVLAPGAEGPALRLLGGGGQERGHRSGTENVAAIAGFGAAAEAAGRDLAGEDARQRRLRDLAETELRRLAPEAVIFGEGVERLPNTLAFAVAGVAAETALMSLDLSGIAVSSGSACSSGKVARSHVLAAMGVPEALARGAIRVSFGWHSTQEDVMRFAQGFETLLQRLYERRAARAA